MFEWLLPTMGTLLRGVGALRKGLAGEAASDYNAQLNQRNASIARQNAAEQEQRFRRLSRKRMGELRSHFGASGFGLSGSAIDALADSAVQEELDALTIRYEGELKAQGLDASAGLDRMRARESRMGGFIGAGAEILLGASTVFDRMGQRTR